MAGGRCVSGRPGRHPALSGHAAAVGAVVGVVHFSAAAVWFGGLVLLGSVCCRGRTWGCWGAVACFSSVAFTALVVIVVTGIVMGLAQ
jgi:putative copper export protein